MRYFSQRHLIKWSYLLPIILFLDPSAFENAVSGRMEAICLLFALLAYFKYFNQSTTYSKYAYIGLFISLSYLTTPRAVILFIPLAYYIVKDLIVRKNITPFIILCISFVIPIGIWIVSSVGTLDGYLDLYLNGKNFHSGDKTAVEAYLMGGFNINAYKVMLYGLLIISFIIPKQLTLEQKRLNYAFSFIAFLFLFLVKDVGSYFAYISPLVAFIVFLNFQNSTFKLSYIALLGLAGFNVLIFGLKLSYNYINDNKIYDEIDKMVDLHIPENTRVITNYEFYYSLREKPLDLYYLQFGKDPETRIDYYINTVKPEYILTTRSESKLNMFSSAYDYKAIAEYPKTPVHPLISTFYYKLGNFFRLDYQDLVIYKLTPKSD